MRRAVIMAAPALALAAFVPAEDVTGHALPLRACHVPALRWEKLTTPQQARYVRCNLRHARTAISWVKVHRHLYGRGLAAVSVRGHRAIVRKARANLRRLERLLHPPPVIETWPWIALADCESGDGDGQPPYRPWWGYNIDFEGGLNFTYDTWASYGGLAYASHAYYATPYQQVTVARRVLADVGWGAWPVCSYKIGAR